MIDPKDLSPHLLIVNKLVFEPTGFRVTNFKKEAESEDYEACEFELNNKQIKFRVGKITPTKVGQFVTLWKRIGKGPIMPYDMADPIDLFVISVSASNHKGLFVFPKAVLCEKGIVSRDGKGGKRAMRIYPSWDSADNAQAKKTQSWQLLYFFEIDPDKSGDITTARKLFF